MDESPAAGGYAVIHTEQRERLIGADLAAAAARLGLPLNGEEAVEVPFFGHIHLVGREGVARADGKPVSHAAAGVLIHYVLDAGPIRPAGRFATFAELAGPLFSHGGYSIDALERPIIRRFQGKVGELLERSTAAGGRREGEGGLGSVSLVFDLLPNLPMQLVFYEGDEEFPARATLLFDRNAVRMLAFEALAFLVTVFVRCLTAP